MCYEEGKGRIITNKHKWLKIKVNEINSNSEIQSKYSNARANLQMIQVA